MTKQSVLSVRKTLRKRPLLFCGSSFLFCSSAEMYNHIFRPSGKQWFVYVIQMSLHSQIAGQTLFIILPTNFFYLFLPNSWYHYLKSDE